MHMLLVFYRLEFVLLYIRLLNIVWNFLIIRAFNGSTPGSSQEFTLGSISAMRGHDAFLRCFIYSIGWQKPNFFISYLCRLFTRHNNVGIAVRDVCYCVITFLVKVKVKAFPYSIPSVGPGADPSVQAVSPQVTVSHPPGGRVGCHYFPPGLRLPPQPQSITALWPVPSYTAWWQKQIGLNNLPNVVTQRCLE